VAQPGKQWWIALMTRTAPSRSWISAGCTSAPTSRPPVSDGRLAIRYRGVKLAYRTFDKIRQVSQGAIVENKQLGAALALIREQQLRRGPERRSGPRRPDQRDARLFKVG
jgi:hypothetical protein